MNKAKLKKFQYENKHGHASDNITSSKTTHSRSNIPTQNSFYKRNTYCDSNSQWNCVKTVEDTRLNTTGTAFKANQRTSKRFDKSMHRKLSIMRTRQAHGRKPVTLENLLLKDTLKGKHSTTFQCGMDLNSLEWTEVDDWWEQMLSLCLWSIRFSFTPTPEGTDPVSALSSQVVHYPLMLSPMHGIIHSHLPRHAPVPSLPFDR